VTNEETADDVRGKDRTDHRADVGRKYTCSLRLAARTSRKERETFARLGMPSWSDNCSAKYASSCWKIHEAVFSSSVHGFPEGTRCHTALREIKYLDRRCMVHEGDIKDCFGSLPRHPPRDNCRENP